MVTGMRRTKVVALTPGGAEVAGILSRNLPHAELWLPPALANEQGAQTFGRLRQVFEAAFSRKENLVCIMAAGIVVRHLAPLLQGKDRDPAVVVVDEAGRFAISLLSGHLGGANELARRVAEILGGTPVITTASEVRGLPALDLLAREAGLVVENPEVLKEVSMALLSGKRVGLWDPGGCLRPRLGEAVSLFQEIRPPEAELAASPGPVVYVDIRERPWPPGWLRLRPKCLVAGVGCHRGTPAREILHFLIQVFQNWKLSLRCLAALATIKARREEPGLQEAARELEVELLWFTREELAAVPVPNPSTPAALHLGVKSVCEAAALKAAGGELLVPKQKCANVTVAVARVTWPWSA